MCFKVDFNWATQAIMETVHLAFPSLESPPGVAVNDPPPPQLQQFQSSPNQVTMVGNGRWNRDTSYRFNAGCNPDVYVAAPEGEKGVLPQGEAERVVLWFQRRYPNNKPGVLKKGKKWNLYLTHQQCAYFFHLTVDDAR